MASLKILPEQDAGMASSQRRAQVTAENVPAPLVGSEPRTVTLMESNGQWSQDLFCSDRTNSDCVRCLNFLHAAQMSSTAGSSDKRTTLCKKVLWLGTPYHYQKMQTGTPSELLHTAIVSTQNININRRLFFARLEVLTAELRNIQVCYDVTLSLG